MVQPFSHYGKQYRSLQKEKKKNDLEIQLPHIPVILFLGIEGVQNKSPSNIPLWHVDYFELKAFKTQQIQEKLLPLPYLPKSI